MNLRWLFGNFADPSYNLSRETERVLSNDAHERFMKGRLFFIFTIAITVPIVIVMYKIVFPAFLGWMGVSNSTLWFAISTLAFAAVFWVYSAWMYRFLYIRPFRHAMRARGYDICITCGYDLRNLNASIERCPECGEVRPGETTSEAE